MEYVVIYLIAVLTLLRFFYNAKHLSYTDTEIAEQYEQQYRDLNKRT